MNISLWQRGGQGKTYYRGFSFILIYIPSSLACSHNANKTSSKQAERQKKALKQPTCRQPPGETKRGRRPIPSFPPCIIFLLAKPKGLRYPGAWRDVSKLCQQTCAAQQSDGNLKRHMSHFSTSCRAMEAPSSGKHVGNCTQSTQLSPGYQLFLSCATGEVRPECTE